MPNIIINNYCNQKCEYCFAKKTMNTVEKKDMNTLLFLKILKYLKENNYNSVRILWWEPFISKNIRIFILLSIKWWFDMIIFSNINIQNEKIKNIFTWIQINENFRINCNINNLEFYSRQGIVNIYKNLTYFNSIWIKLILWYNIYDLNKKADFLFELATKHKISSINLKITNTSIWDNLIIDNSKRELWIYIFELIKKYHKNFFIEISCWLDAKIFSKDELDYIIKKTQIKLKYWCDWNIWKFDINYDWYIYKCFPLWIKNKNTPFYDLMNNNISNDKKNTILDDFFKDSKNWQCLANQLIINQN